MEWQEQLRDAIRAYQKAEGLDDTHFVDTAARVVRAYAKMNSGSLPAAIAHLSTTFPAKQPTGNSMVHVGPIRINASCAHHHMPIVGIAYFAYIPKNKIVGLSKIPRFITELSRRLVVQEELCDMIVDLFSGYVSMDCALWMKAYHCCMSTRGAEEHQAMTIVPALRGAFDSNAHTRREFYANINTSIPVIG